MLVQIQPSSTGVPHQLVLVFPSSTSLYAAMSSVPFLLRLTAIFDPLWSEGVTLDLSFPETFGGQCGSVSSASESDQSGWNAQPDQQHS